MDKYVPRMGHIVKDKRTDECFGVIANYDALVKVFSDDGYIFHIPYNELEYVPCHRQDVYYQHWDRGSEVYAIYLSQNKSKHRKES